MKKLLDAFKALPKEVKAMLILIGVGTPVAAAYTVKRWLFPHTSWPIIILGVLGVLLVVMAVGWLISWLFLGRSRKRRDQMASKLATDGARGPVSIEVGAAIKANNEKFFSAVRDMRKNIGISVYDLPWYIVIGDSGCGKTKLVNEGGLTFSTGKPEGYQLGTLNYNWWFTEDAIFIDMAGRLCNPQDDADHREWQAFLNTVGKGRPGFPINGAFVCVSADHLLQDPPERVEADANTALERLRDLQTKLGVTFATYLIITKCDKILGFMQFFDRAERDITVKNQIFGWSKPGNFNELYDPETFKHDFEDLYGRLHELRLRRLADDADEADLGLAYAFAEEFRELLSPLETYVRTLFPMIRNPRAVKNLIFRGIYFTSATQEGNLILKHFSERLGADAADQFSTLDLYPNKRPHFIKDVFFRKAFPEHGLVFRNEEQVVRNRKLSRLLQIGTAVATVVFIVALALSFRTFARVIGQPRLNAQETLTHRAEGPPAEALKLAQTLSGDVDTLKQHTFSAKILSLGLGADRPIRDLTMIRAALFQRRVLTSVIDDVSESLRRGSILDQPGEDPALALQKHVSALEEYLLWAGCKSEPGGAAPTELDIYSLEGFQRLTAIVSDQKSIVNAQRDAVLAEAHTYFATLRERGRGVLDPSALFDTAGRNSRDVVRSAVVALHDRLRPYATLTGSHPDPIIRRWMGIRTACESVNTSLAGMLELVTAGASISTLEEAQSLQSGFVQNYESFDAALRGATWARDNLTGQGIPSLLDAILRQRGEWVAIEQRLQAAFQRCGRDDATAFIPSLSLGYGPANVDGLDRVLWQELRRNGLVNEEYAEGAFERERFAKLFLAIPRTYAHVIRTVPEQATAPEPAPQRLDEIQLTEDAVKVNAFLRPIHERIAAHDFAALAGASSSTAAEWVTELESLLYPEEGTAVSAEMPALAMSEPWRRDELASLADAYLAFMQRGRGTLLLASMQQRLDAVADGSSPWAFAELAEGWREPGQSSYRIDIPEAQVAAPAATQVTPPPARPTSRPPATRPGSRPPTRPGAVTRPVAPPRSEESSRRLREIPACATAEFLQARFEECLRLLYYLKLFTAEDGYYYRAADARAAVNDACAESVRRAWRQYAATYVSEWDSAYRSLTIEGLDEAGLGQRGWEAFARQFGGDRTMQGTARRVADAFEPPLAEVLRNIVWLTYDPQVGSLALPFEGDAFRRERGILADDVYGALAQHWKGGEFATLASGVTLTQDQAASPWSTTAAGFALAWKELAVGIADNAVIPADFTPDSAPLRQIQWGRLQALRQSTRLADERITAELIAFEEFAQQLLSHELSERLRGVQQKHLGAAEADGGWPYLARRGGEGAMATVNFTDFKRFLLDVGYARAALAPLEGGLPERDAQKLVRGEFYRSCESWSSFIGLRQDVSDAPLRVAVQGGDAKGDPRFSDKIADTAQQHYRFVELYLGQIGWQSDAPGSTSVRGPVRVPTSVSGRATPYRATWDWSISEGGDAKVSFTEGFPTAGGGSVYPARTDPLGPLSPLALSAYLHAYGYSEGDGRIHRTLHTVTVDAAPGGGEPRTLGEMLVFELERPMPGPIRPMQKASPPAPWASRSAP